MVDFQKIKKYSLIFLVLLVVLVLSGNGVYIFYILFALFIFIIVTIFVALLRPSRGRGHRYYGDNFSRRQSLQDVRDVSRVSTWSQLRAIDDYNLIEGHRSKYGFTGGLFYNLDRSKTRKNKKPRGLW